MKRTIRRRTEITIESLEITTIRHMRSALSPDAPSEDGTTHLPTEEFGDGSELEGTVQAVLTRTIPS